MDEVAQISSAEEQLKNYGQFLENHDKKLEDLVENCSLKDIENAETLTIEEPLVHINYTTNREKFSLLHLLKSERMLNKTLLTFAHLCVEVKLIVKESYDVQMKLLFMDEDLCNVDLQCKNSVPGAAAIEPTNEQLLLNLSKSMEFLCQLQFLLQRCIVLGNNLLHQCGAFYATDNVKLEFKCFDVFDHLADLLLQIVIFDEILNTSNYARLWPMYKKTFEAITYNGGGLEYCTNSEINGLQNCIYQLDFLFTGSVFRSFLDSTFSLKDKIGQKGLNQLTQQFNEYLKYNITLIDKFPAVDLNDLFEPQMLIRLNAFTVVFHDFCGKVETKSIKHLLELNTKHQGIILIGNINWTPSKFLIKHADNLIKTQDKHLHDVKRLQQFLQNHLQTLQRDCRTYCMQMTLWSLNMRKAFGGSDIDLRVEKFKDCSSLLLQGLYCAGQISFLIKALVNAHATLQSPMTKPTLLEICKLIEILKLIQKTFDENPRNISKLIHCILQYLEYKILQIFENCKKKLENAKSHERKNDSLAAIKIAEKCMNGPANRTRILVTKLAINATNANQRTLSNEQMEKFNVILQHMELFADFQINLKKVCDTSFIYWHQSILAVYVKQMIERKTDFNSFQYLIHSGDGCSKTLDSLSLNNLHLTRALRKTNFDNVRNEIISSLCAQIETFLRLEVHSNLQLEKICPFEQSINDYRDLINACTVEINGNYVALKDHVENYLSAMFYNLTTISLHDWKTYEEMRHLANNRLMLKPVEDYLPNQTLEQGIDILEIMRKIHIFVSKYVYNMNSQIFVEQKSVNKHLDSIGIRHVANSLRTHGSGVINTTVNFTYQFLRQKFYIFSQFLYDEQIKSRLMKELRSFAERKKTERTPLYPYERADAFNKDIRRLGLTNDDQTYMDLFRKVITHVGNAMGYIRLVRSGNIHANYSASLYLPKFDDNLQFVEKINNEEMQDVTVKAAENFEVNVSNLVKSFSDSTDYFKLLVEAFDPFFQNPHNLHLKNFFLIVPPLTLNFVEHMLNVKEKINRKEREEAVLFDDGFAVGLAYILRLLNQIGDFNSLQWFSTVRERFDTERRKVHEMVAEVNVNANSNTNINAKTKTTTTNSTTTTTMNGMKTNKISVESEKLQQTLALTERRIHLHEFEFNMLYYNLCSAKIFFNNDKETQ